ncbi:MAG: methyltransferase domain-containing protein [Bryobacter sp.]|nr:methyltransferase domain-containing protein [Bryobacter sp.]
MLFSLSAFNSLLCPVRACGQPLTPHHRTFLCPHGHSFDLARSGYLNLLQPQDKRSAHPGDSKAAALARRLLHDHGHTRPFLDFLLTHVSPTDHLLDLGCGEGFFLGEIQQRTACQATGVDLSAPAIDLAARRYPQPLWIVANADRPLPFAAASFSLLLSITARRQPAEFHRLLAPHGRLLLATPAPEDLKELRGSTPDRTPQILAEFSPYFTLQSHTRLTHTAPLTADELTALRLSIYRPLTNQEPTAQEVTFSLDFNLLGKVIY